MGQADADPDASDGADRSVLATAALANQWEAAVVVVVDPSYQNRGENSTKMVMLSCWVWNAYRYGKRPFFFTHSGLGASIVWISRWFWGYIFFQVFWLVQILNQR